MEEFPGEQSSADDKTNQVPVTPPSAMPLSMPPVTPLDAAAAPTSPTPTSSDPSAGSSHEPFPPSAMPLSMPPYVNLERAVPPRSEQWSGDDVAGGWASLPLAEEALHQNGWSKRKGVSVIMAAVLIAGAAGAGIGVAFGSNSSSPGVSATKPGKLAPITSGSAAPLAPSSSVSEVAKTVTPAVVDIQTTINSTSGTGQAAGTGMIITSSGEVLTNNHVVQGATTISVSITGRSQPASATVVGVDPTHDVAVLQLQGVSGLPYVSLGDSSTVKLGTSVVAIGNALGLGGTPTVTSGQITALNRSIKASDQTSSTPESLSNLLQTDAQIQPGDSGGPLVNSSGQVIGMDTAAASSDGGPAIGFAIPINQARTIAQNIVNGNATGGIILGLSAFLGVDVQAASGTSNTVSPGFGFGFGNSGASTPGTSTGQYVMQVVAGGPAAKAGIVAGDTITSLNGTAITNDNGSLTTALGALKPGDTAHVGIVNQAGTAQTVTVVLGGIPK